MEHGRFKLHRRALIALNELPGPDQAEILDKLAQVVDLPAAEWSARGARRLADHEPLYLLRVNASLRVILRAIDGAPPEVLDVVRHETLETFANAGPDHG
jgi:hypothetical protein